MTKSKNASSDDESALGPSQGLEDDAFFAQSVGNPDETKAGRKKKLRSGNTLDISSTKISPRNALAPKTKSSKKKNRKLHFMNLRQDSVFHHVDTGLNSYQIDENIKKAHESSGLREINESGTQSQMGQKFYNRQDTLGSDRRQSLVGFINQID